jgi:hypothetical protein
MESKNRVTPKDIITRRDGGGFYYFDGEMYNGGRHDETGKWQPYICRDTVSRRVDKVDIDRGVIYCECGREFIINEKLIIIKGGA